MEQLDPKEVTYNCSEVASRICKACSNSFSYTFESTKDSAWWQICTYSFFDLVWICFHHWRRVWTLRTWERTSGSCMAEIGFVIILAHFSLRHHLLERCHFEKRLKASRSLPAQPHWSRSVKSINVRIYILIVSKYCTHCTIGDRWLLIRTTSTNVDFHIKLYI